MFVIDKYGSQYIAHYANCDCTSDNAIHGVSDHPVAALRLLIKAIG